MGGFVVAPSHLLEPDGDQQIAALDAVLLGGFEQAPPPREPSTRSAALAPEEQVVADPERAAGSGRHLLGFEVRMVGALQSADVVVVSAEHVRGARQELEIRRVERRGPIRVGQRLERFAPRTPGVGRATSFRLDDRIHRSDYRPQAIDPPAVDGHSPATCRYSPAEANPAPTEILRIQSVGRSQIFGPLRGVQYVASENRDSASRFFTFFRTS
jgi:hypothetical protein